MRIPGAASGFVALSVACATTVGSMYVTLSAAASNAGPADNAEAAAAEPAEPQAYSGIGSMTGRLSKIAGPDGELAPAGEVDVSIATVNGTRFTTKTDGDGTFGFGEVPAGAYTVSANSAQGVVSYGIIIPSEDDTQPAPLAVDFQVDSALAPGSDLAAVREVVTAALQGALVEAEPRRSEGGRGNAPDEENVTAYQHEQVQLTPEGSLTGQANLLDPVTRDLTRVDHLTASLIADGGVVATSEVAANGDFTMRNVLPGVHTLVVAGRDGVAVLGVDLVSNYASAGTTGDSDYVKTSTRLQPAEGVQLPLVKGGGPLAAEGIGAPLPSQGQGPGPEGDLPPEELIGGPFPPGGAPFGGPGGFPGGGVGGGIGGGGAGGGGGGLMAALIGGGIGAAIGAAVADDDDGPATPGN